LPALEKYLPALKFYLPALRIYLPALWKGLFLNNWQKKGIGGNYIQKCSERCFLMQLEKMANVMMYLCSGNPKTECKMKKEIRKDSFFE